MKTISNSKEPVGGGYIYRMSRWVDGRQIGIGVMVTRVQIEASRKAVATVLREARRQLKEATMV